MFAGFPNQSPLLSMMEVERTIYGRKKQSLQACFVVAHSSGDLIKSPDEWATTKQVCRDEPVVYLFFSLICIYIYIYIYILEGCILHCTELLRPFSVTCMDESQVNRLS